jgi:hypothetical protein
VEDSEAEAQVHGVPAEQLAEEDVPVRYGDGVVDDDRGFDEVPASGPDPHDPVVAVRGGGFTPETPDDEPGSGNRADRPEGDRADRPGADRPHPLGEAPVGEEASDAEPGEPSTPRRPRRNGRRIPVPA